MTQKYVVPLTGILFCAGVVLFGIDALVAWISLLIIDNELVRSFMLFIYSILIGGIFTIVVTTLYD